MLASRAVVKVWVTASVVAAAALLIGNGCSSKNETNGMGAPGQSGSASGGQTVGQGGSSPGAGAAVGGNSTGGANSGGVSTSGASTGGSSMGGGSTGGASSGGVGPQGGSATGGSTVGGSAGAGLGGSGGNTTGGSTSGGAGGASADCGTPPWRKLNVSAAPGEHIHGKAGLDTRAKTMLGKLVIDYGVSGGGYSSFLAKRGYHSIGAPAFTECPAPDLGGDRTRVSKCRMGEFMTTGAAIKATLTQLQGQYPEEDWGYFLTQDGSDIRWSDVAVTGISHGATTAAVAGHVGACVWRVVSRAGPRDNTCGLGNGNCTLPLSTPSYDPNCAQADIASWLDEPSKTPIDRFYGIVGTSDGQCGDITFNMHHTGYLGVPTVFDMAGAVFTGTNQFVSTTQGHFDFLAAPTGALNTPAVLEIAFGIPVENRNPTF